MNTPLELGFLWFYMCYILSTVLKNEKAHAQKIP